MSKKPTHQARAAKRKKKLEAMGDLSDVRARLWAGIEAVDAILSDESAAPELKLRGVHALTQAAGAYAKLVESCELEARVAEMERRLENNDTRV